MSFQLWPQPPENELSKEEWDLGIEAHRQGVDPEEAVNAFRASKIPIPEIEPVKNPTEEFVNNLRTESIAPETLAKAPELPGGAEATTQINVVIPSAAPKRMGRPPKGSQ